MENAKTVKLLKIAFVFAVLLNIVFWSFTRDLRAKWINVPPVPTKFTAVSSTLGDEQFAARVISIMLQNIGSTGGRVTPIKNYDFEKLGAWLNLHYTLDQNSNLVPYLAGYYFGASQDPSKIRPIINYLRRIGNRAEGEQWRWLARAIYLARYKYGDLNLALEMADELNAMNREDIPNWAKDLKVRILNQKGEKEAALEEMLLTLKDQSQKMHPNEVNARIAYICEQILDPSEAKTHSLCVDFNK